MKNIPGYIGIIVGFVLTTMFFKSAHAQTIITPQGNYTVQQSQQGSTTYITGPRGSAGAQVAVPVQVNPITGVGQVITPNGSYMVQQSSSGTTTIIQTSKSR